jgi:hypothetical protein
LPFVLDDHHRRPVRHHREPNGADI